MNITNEKVVLVEKGEKFSKKDFEDEENMEKLRLIIMNKLQIPLMTNFHILHKEDKQTFNFHLNEYIVALPSNNWKKVLDADFTKICRTKLFNKSFQPEIYDTCQEIFSHTIL